MPVAAEGFQHQRLRPLAVTGLDEAQVIWINPNG